MNLPGSPEGSLQEDIYYQKRHFWPICNNISHIITHLLKQLTGSFYKLLKTKQIKP